MPEDWASRWDERRPSTQQTIESELRSAMQRLEEENAVLRKRCLRQTEEIERLAKIVEMYAPNLLKT